MGSFLALKINHLISHKMSDMHLLKSTIKKLFGKKAWIELKKNGSLRVWKKYLIKTLDAIHISVNETVVIRDESWVEAISENIELGKSHIKKATTFDEAISVFSSTLIHQSFIQIGLMPNRSFADSVNLRKENWKLDSFRSIIIVQNPEQVESVFWSVQQREIGFEAQLKLKEEHRYSKSKLSYSEWCKSRLS